MNPKHEDFCRVYVETGNASEAYRSCYPTEKMSRNTLHRKAHEVMQRPYIKDKIDELRSYHAKRHEVTVDMLLDELNEAREMALESRLPGVMINATMSKAKLLGLDKQVIEHSGSIASLDLDKHLSSDQLATIAREVLAQQGLESD